LRFSADFLATVADDLILNGLPFIEGVQAGLLDR
jgi:hypothetical protein